jgi:hypothetical protein
MSRPTFENDFHRVLYDRVHECAVPDFKALLEKYGDDDGCLKIMKEALDDRLSREDSGDWTSSASPGWKPTREKQKALDRHILDRGPRRDFRQAASRTADAPRPEAAQKSDVESLREEITALRQRVAKLEARKLKL